jgi:hypothetical protein
MELSMKRAFLCLFLVACGSGSSGDDDDLPATPDADPGERRGTIAAVAGDFASTGILSTVGAPTQVVRSNAVAGVVGADPAIRRIGDELFVINRFGTGGDNIVILDAATLQLVDQIATGAGSNPQDVALVDGKLYVAALGAGAVLVIDRADPTTIGEIDLSELDDDGLPDCISAYAVGDRVFVACGVLDNFFADQNGKVAVIDTTDDSVETTFDLPSRNPQGWLTPIGNELLIGTVPDFVDYSTGCVAAISTGDTPAAACGATNQDLDGFASKLTPEGWAVVTHYDAEFNTAGWLVDLANPGTGLTAAEQVAQDLVVCGSYLFVSESGQGIRFHHIDDDGSLAEITVGALDLGLPPAFGNGIACQQP